MDLAVLEFMPDAVLVTTGDGTIRFVNRAAEQLFGHARADLLGRPIEALIPARSRSSHRLARQAYAAAPRVRPMGLGLDLRALARDGHEIPVEISLSPIQLGTELCTIAAVRDVTERKRLEERERAAERAEQEVRQRDEILAVASHELRAPVGTVQLQVDLLQRAAADAVEDLGAMRDRMNRIARSAGHLARLVEDLLDMRQLRASALPLRIEELDLVELAREAVDRLREQVERTGAALSFHGPTPVRGRWDPLRMHQVVTNLLVNASKFGRGEPILVSVEGDGARARLAVADRGIGIDVKDHDRIFERFAQAASPEEVRQGLGLGLFIVRRIVHAHGGRVLLRSALGEGSTFTVELPMDGVAAA